MLDKLRTWLNGNREYYSGVTLYASVGTNKDLLLLFQKGQNDFREKRLHEELLLICKQLKNANATNTTSEPDKSGTASKSDNKSHTLGQNNSDKKRTESVLPVNEELYNTCKATADKHYKEVMNKRAVLFSLARLETTEDPNTEERINARSLLSVQVVNGYKNVSQLYEQADFVKMHGYLPDQSDTDENEYEHLPNELVKQTLDNLRKNYNKIKSREQTPDRVALLQKHKSNIEKLESKWRLLKPTQ